LAHTSSVSIRYSSVARLHAAACAVARVHTSSRTGAAKNTKGGAQAIRLFLQYCFAFSHQTSAALAAMCSLHCYTQAIMRARGVRLPSARVCTSSHIHSTTLALPSGAVACHCMWSFVMLTVRERMLMLTAAFRVRLGYTLYSVRCTVSSYAAAHIHMIRQSLPTKRERGACK
jgi:hypothetical protein